mgnify:CR=1 FL=1
MTTELSKGYQPGDVESQWYTRWVDAGCFRGNETGANEAYSIVIPPPNVTGILHLGHVLNNTIQDILARRARMEGKDVSNKLRKKRDSLTQFELVREL